MDIDCIKKRMRRVTVVFRGFVFFLLILFVYLIVDKNVVFLKYLVFFASFLFSAAFVFLVRMQQTLPKGEGSSKFEEMLNNVNEAQKIINSKKQIYSKNFPVKIHNLNSDLFAFDGFIDFIQSPVTWICCLAINYVLIFNPIYIEIFNIQELPPQVIAKLWMLSILQFLFFGLCISGIYLSISKFIKRC